MDIKGNVQTKSSFDKESFEEAASIIPLIPVNMKSWQQFIACGHCSSLYRPWCGHIQELILDTYMVIYWFPPGKQSDWKFCF